MLALRGKLQLCQFCDSNEDADQGGSGLAPFSNDLCRPYMTSACSFALSDECYKVDVLIIDLSSIPDKLANILLMHTNTLFTFITVLETCWWNLRPGNSSAQLIYAI